MRKVKRTKAFLRDLAVCRRADFPQEIDSILYYLIKGEELPADYRAHRLKWQWTGFWDVHLDDDWILIYRLTPRSIILTRLVTHDELREQSPWGRWKRK